MLVAVGVTTILGKVSSIGTAIIISAVASKVGNKTGNYVSTKIKRNTV